MIWLDFTTQAAGLAAAVVALYLRGDRAETGRWPTTWRQWREIAAAVVVCVAAFALVSQGRGCASSPYWQDDGLEDPDPFGRP